MILWMHMDYIYILVNTREINLNGILYGYINFLPKLHMFVNFIVMESWHIFSSYISKPPPGNIKPNLHELCYVVLNIYPYISSSSYASPPDMDFANLLFTRSPDFFFNIWTKT